MGKIIITISDGQLVNIEIPIKQTIIFEFENVVFIQHASPKKNVVPENFEISP
jgi:bisphosphoglycerate-dependent phosphoglycerate mutase